MLMLGDDKVMEMDGNGNIHAHKQYIYNVYIHIDYIGYIGFCWVSCLAFAGR